MSLPLSSTALIESLVHVPTGHQAHEKPETCLESSTAPGTVFAQQIED